MKFVPNSVTRSVATSILKAKKSSPNMFFGVGLAGMVTSTVLACRSTLKLEKVVDEVNNDIQSVKELNDSKKKSATLSYYDDSEYYKDMAHVYAKSARKIVRLYGPAIVVGVASAGALTGSHVQLARRNAALTVTLGLATTAFDEYRDRVRNEIGKEREAEVHTAVESQVVTRQDGLKEVVKVTDPNRWSPYARVFDEGCSAWEKHAEINRLYVQLQQNYFNNKLQTRGHVFLNEIYDAFGIERSQAGAVVGWVIGDNGDNFIDFGMFEAYNRDFVNGQERSIILDFNVDGVIYDKI